MDKRAKTVGAAAMAVMAGAASLSPAVAQHAPADRLAKKIDMPGFNSPADYTALASSLSNNFTVIVTAPAKRPNLETVWSRAGKRLKAFTAETGVDQDMKGMMECAANVQSRRELMTGFMPDGSTDASRILDDHFNVGGRASAPRFRPGGYGFTLQYKRTGGQDYMDAGVQTPSGLMPTAIEAFAEYGLDSVGINNGGTSQARCAERAAGAPLLRSAMRNIGG